MPPSPLAAHQHPTARALLVGNRLYLKAFKHIDRLAASPPAVAVVEIFLTLYELFVRGH